MHQLAGNSTAAFNPENFITGEKQPITKPILVENGDGAIAQYSVMGRVTATGEYKFSLAAAVDGSQVPDCIVADACDATLAAANVGAFFEGQFNPNLLVLGTGHTIASITAGLRDKSIHLRIPGA